ncbi:MAG: polyprenyl synthetase family protein [Actinomycetota bacterium]
MSGPAQHSDPLARLELDIREDLERVENGLRAAVASGQPLVQQSAGHVLASGGKRFRPMLVLLSGRLGAYEANEKALVDCAVAIELTHLATLYHDDVMDEAAVRRGHQSANARFDNTVAILAGDWLFARASAIAADLGTYPSRVLADTIATVCEGQIMEAEHTGTPNQSIERYLETIKRKTAALLATSCHLGAWIADCAPQVVDAVTDYGESLGMAFQLYDDVLDIAGVAEESGKVPGTDLREGVWTMAVLDTLAGDGADDGSSLRNALSNNDIDAALAILRENGSTERATKAGAEWTARAVNALNPIPDGTARVALAALAHFVVSRSA